MNNNDENTCTIFGFENKLFNQNFLFSVILTNDKLFVFMKKIISYILKGYKI